MTSHEDTRPLRDQPEILIKSRQAAKDVALELAMLGEGVGVVADYEGPRADEDTKQNICCAIGMMISRFGLALHEYLDAIEVSEAAPASGRIDVSTHSLTPKGI